MDENIQFLRTYFDQGLSLDCKGCYSCCTVIRIAEQELEAILRLLAKKGYKEAPAGKGMRYCEYLDTDGKCVVYEERPMLCRSHGTMDDEDSVCDVRDNFKKAVIPQPPEFLDYIENNKFIINTTGKRLLEEYLT